MTDPALVLVAEDEDEIAAIVEAYLFRDGFRVARARDGTEALEAHARLRPDLLILDIRMPKADGMYVLNEVRRRGVTPVIMATAVAEDLDKLLALRIGADDYIVKPFNPLEVVARVRAVLRRTHAKPEAAVLRVGCIEVDLDAHAVRVVVAGAPPTGVDLTPTEFALLERMARTPRRAFARSELLESGNPDRNALDRVVDSHMSHLRRKLVDAGATQCIVAVRGLGYRLQPDP
jgi:two-component system, OmpR family, response regulator AdeR